MNTRRDWPVSTTGGSKIGGEDAARLLDVSKAQLYNLIERDELKRAEPRKRNVRRQPLVFFLADVVALALEYETLTEGEASELLQGKHPNRATVKAVA